METLSFDDASKKYVDAVMEKGNPAYFVWKFVHNLSNQELAQCLEEFFDGEEFYVVDE